MNRRRGGFTLVEMIVALAASSIVVLAGMSFVMMCLRVQSVSYTDVSRQDAARVALTLVETLAQRGELDECKNGDTELKSGTNSVLSYDKSTKTVYVGADSGTPLMSNVEFSATVDDRLLTVTLKDMDNDGAEYSTTVFCRDWPRQPGPYLLNKTEIFGPEISEVEGYRFELLKTAVGQFGSDGFILNENGVSTGQTFATWYSSKWGPNTAWCACFVSWCIDQKQICYKDYNEVTFLYGNVRDWWDAIGTDTVYEKAAAPTPGDLIFFDNDKNEQADHVGFVLRTETDGTIYTVEGNNDNKVVIAEYKMGGPGILGYAKLPWKSEAGG